MGTLINISSPQQQLRQNRSMLLLIASVSSLLGLLLWSASPFIFSNPKDKVAVCLRYFSLLSTLGCGVAAVVSGRQLEQISPLIKAIDTAERNDFLEQLAVSQYRQQQHWQQMAIAPTQLQPLSQQVQQARPESSEASSTTSTDELPTSQNSEVNGSEHFRSLYKSVSLLKEQGLSDTKLVEEVLGMGGRKFNEGKQMLDALLQLGKQQGW
jgi:hypothetical protein